MGAVPQDGHTVRYFEDLLQAVRNVHGTYAERAQFRDGAKQA
jgi:hypothetical protein